MPSHERDIYERKARVIKRRMEEQESQQKARLQEQEKLIQAAHHHEMVSHADPHHVGVTGAPGMSTSISQAPIQLQTPTQQTSAALSATTPHHPATMQFYQATPGAPGTASVIQLMHTSSPSTAANSNSGAAAMQPRSGMLESPLVTGATVLTNQMSHAPVLATAGGQQVCCLFEASMVS